MTGPVTWNSLCKPIGAAAVLALLTGAASAQMLPSITLNPDSSRPLSPEEKQKQKALDDKYRSTMQSIPDKKAPADPWGNIRAAPTTPKQR